MTAAGLLPVATRCWGLLHPHAKDNTQPKFTNDGGKRKGELCWRSRKGSYLDVDAED